MRAETGTGDTEKRDGDGFDKDFGFQRLNEGTDSVFERGGYKKLLVPRKTPVTIGT